MFQKQLGNDRSEIPALCHGCESRHSGICGALRAKELTELASHTRIIHQEAGDVFTAEAMPVGTHAIILNGVVKLTKLLHDGRQQVVGLHFAPDFLGRLFGDESLFGVEFASDVELCTIPRQALERMIEQNPELGKRLMYQAQRELDEAREWLVTLGRKTAAEKVASYLVYIATHIDPSTKGEATHSFDLPMTRGDSADFLGLTIETVSRQLSKLRAAAVIATQGARHVEILQLDQLRKIAA